MSNLNIQPGLMYSGTKVSFKLAIEVPAMHPERNAKRQLCSKQQHDGKIYL